MERPRADGLAPAQTGFQGDESGREEAREPAPLPGTECPHRHTGAPRVIFSTIKVFKKQNETNPSHSFLADGSSHVSPSLPDRKSMHRPDGVLRAGPEVVLQASRARCLHLISLAGLGHVHWSAFKFTYSPPAISNPLLSPFSQFVISVYYSCQFQNSHF